MVGASLSDKYVSEYFMNEDSMSRSSPKLHLRDVRRWEEERERRRRRRGIWRKISAPSVKYFSPLWSPQPQPSRSPCPARLCSSRLCSARRPAQPQAPSQSPHLRSVRLFQGQYSATDLISPQSASSSSFPSSSLTTRPSSSPPSLPLFLHRTLFSNVKRETAEFGRRRRLLRRQGLCGAKETRDLTSPTTTMTAGAEAHIFDEILAFEDLFLFDL